jgi:hypothetical protein
VPARPDKPGAPFRFVVALERATDGVFVDEFAPYTYAVMSPLGGVGSAQVTLTDLTSA